MRDRKGQVWELGEGQRTVVVVESQAYLASEGDTGVTVHRCLVLDAGQGYERTKQGVRFLGDLLKDSGQTVDMLETPDDDWDVTNPKTKRVRLA